VDSMRHHNMVELTMAMAVIVRVGVVWGTDVVHLICGSTLHAARNRFLAAQLINLSLQWISQTLDCNLR
jgi:hypothetical protein